MLGDQQRAGLYPRALLRQHRCQLTPHSGAVSTRSPAALSPPGAFSLLRYNATRCLLAPSFIQSPHPLTPPPPHLLMEQVLVTRTAANLEGCSQLLESSFKNINSCSKDRSELSNHSKPNFSFLKTDFWEIVFSHWITTVVSSCGRNFSSQRYRRSCGGWWPWTPFIWPCLIFQQEINFIAKLSLFWMYNWCLIHVF